MSMKSYYLLTVDELFGSYSATVKKTTTYSIHISQSNIYNYFSMIHLNGGLDRFQTKQDSFSTA